MSERHVHRVKLSDFKAKKEEEGAIDIEMDDETVFRIPPPELWPDTVGECLAKGETLVAARALIEANGQNYEEFVAKGGSATIILGVIGDIHGETVPESGASSSS